MPLPGISLGSGTLNAIAAATVTADTQRYLKVRYFTLYNVAGTTETVVIKLTRAGFTTRSIATVTLLTGEWAEVFDGSVEVNLSPGDAITGSCTNNGAIEYVILGEYA